MGLYFDYLLARAENHLVEAFHQVSVTTLVCQSISGFKFCLGQILTLAVGVHCGSRYASRALPLAQRVERSAPRCSAQ